MGQKRKAAVASFQEDFFFRFSNLPPDAVRSGYFYGNRISGGKAGDDSPGFKSDRLKPDLHDVYGGGGAWSDFDDQGGEPERKRGLSGPSTSSLFEYFAGFSD